MTYPNLPQLTMDEQLAAPTDATVTRQATCHTTGTARTDAIWLAGNLVGMRGGTRCVSMVNNICDSAHITLDFAELNLGTDDKEDRRKTACHELGHSVGLSHRDDAVDCMINGEIPSTASQWQNYGYHHRQHINDWF